MSTPTVDSLQNEYLACADYDATNDVAKARRFVAACRGLMLLLPTSTSRGGVGGTNSVTFDTRRIAKEGDMAASWLRMRSVPVGPVYADLGGIRE